MAFPKKPGHKFSSRPGIRAKCTFKKCVIWAVVCGASLMGASQQTLGGAPVNGVAEAEQQLKQAVEEIGYLGFDRAYGMFRQAAAKSEEGSELWQQAILGQAICAQQITPPTPARIQEAAELYQKIVARSPKSLIAARATLNLGRIAELVDFYGDPEDLPGARKYYQQVVDNWPGDPIAGEATLRIAASYIQTYKTEEVLQGVSVLHKWLESHPKDVLASAMWQYLGDTYYEPLKEYRKSVDCYQKADDLGLTEKGREVQVYWRVSQLADNELHDRDLAVKYYTKIIVVTPTSGKGYESQLALKRLGAPVPELRLDIAASPSVKEKNAETQTTPKGGHP